MAKTFNFIHTKKFSSPLFPGRAIHLSVEERCFPQKYGLLQALSTNTTYITPKMNHTLTSMNYIE